MVQMRGKGPKCNEHVGVLNSANFAIVSTNILIDLNIKFYKIVAKQHEY